MRGLPFRRPLSGLVRGLLLVLPACAQEAPLPAADLWDGALTFQEFLDGAERRVDAWHGNYEAGHGLSEEMLASAREIPGSWRLLVVAEDYCGDSANTVPYVASLADELDNLEIRVVTSRAGRGVMESFPTPDGRGATPTMVLLDDQGEAVGCLVEQPRPLQDWWLGEAKEIEDDQTRFDEKYAWYARDAGGSTSAEIVGIMAGAAAGTPVCRPWAEGTSGS